MRATQVLSALVSDLDPDRYVPFPELRIGNLGRADGTESQRLDLFVIDLAPPTHARDGYEVKVSRGDYLAEIRNPEKRRLAMLLCNRFTFATPAGLVRPDEVPIDCGLVWVHPYEERRLADVEEVVRAPWHDRGPPTVRFCAELARRCASPLAVELQGLGAAVARAKAERRWVDEDKARVEALRDSAQAQLDALRTALAAERTRR